VAIGNGTELTFWAFALAGTIFFFFRVAAIVLGGFGEAGVDPGSGADVSGGPDFSGTDHPHSGDLNSSESAFKLVSIQSVSGFFMSFGWAGLAGVRQLGWGGAVSFLFATLVGGAVMVLTGFVYKWVGRLKSSGDVFVIEKTVGLVGSVYLRIPAEGRGQIRLVVNTTSRFVNAVSEDRVAIDSFLDVTVVRVVDGQTVSVRKK